MGCSSDISKPFLEVIEEIPKFDPLPSFFTLSTKG